jgi:hypothetical protein
MNIYDVTNKYSGSSRIFLGTLTSGKLKYSNETTPKLKKIVCVSPEKR